jgi:hypothetical protein
VLAVEVREELQVAQDQRRLGGDRQLQPFDPGEDLQQRPRHPVLPLGGLVGVGGGADGDGLPVQGGLAQAADQRLGRALLDEDLLLEVLPAAEIEETVGVAGGAVGAAQLTAPVGVDRPGERHPRRRRSV